MPALTVTKKVAILASSATETEVTVQGMVSVLNVGPEEVFLSLEPTVPVTKAQVDGTIFLPVLVPIPLPREVRHFWHRTASATAKVLLITDVS
jgi:hypothetical protein